MFECRRCQFIETEILDDPIWPTTSISFARMGMLQAIYKDDEPLFGPGKHAAKEPH